MEVTRKDPRTASQTVSVWRDLPEDAFRLHLLNLEEKTGAVPMDPQVFSSVEWLSESPYVECSYTLPLDSEQQLADDFAFLAAVAEGAQSVAAVCVEEHANHGGLILRFAAMDISRNESVNTTLQAVCEILSRAAASESGESPSEHFTLLFQEIVQLHFHRLLARLRSKKWEKPKYLSKSHKKPLWKDFTNLIHRAQFAYTKKEKATRQLVESRLKELASVYENFEDSEDGLSALMHLVDASFTVSMVEEIKDYAQRLQTYTKHTYQVASAIKSLRQIQKIASYRRICMSLVTTAKQYSTLFQRITIHYLVTYKEVPTSIGYHQWATTCHVHAEVQLAVYYDTNPECHPRCIGTSKWLCYLCYQFLRAHKLFFPSKTHGRLYDQWTIPDLMEFEEALIQEYRRILRDIDDMVLQQTELEPEVRKLQRMTSCDFGEFDPT
jgi:hypothetical protein